MHEERIAIKGMNCNHCVMTVQKALAQIPGVTVKEVQIGSAVVVLDNPDMVRASIRTAVEKAGFTVEL